MEQTIVIQKKNKAVAIVFAAVILLVVGVTAIGVLTSFVFPHLPGFLRLKVTALVIIVTVVITALYVIIRPALSKKPGLIIDRRGITDHSNITSVGFIPWSEITAIKEAANAFQQKMIIVVVRNPERYIHQTRWLRDTRRIQYTKFGSPIVIAASNLAYDPQELVSILQERAGTKSKGRFAVE